MRPREEDYRRLQSVPREAGTERLLLLSVDVVKAFFSSQYRPLGMACVPAAPAGATVGVAEANPYTSRNRGRCLDGWVR